MKLANQVTISFTTNDQFPTSVTLPAIDLFLYDVRENRELRSNEWLVERRSNGTTTRPRRHGWTAPTSLPPVDLPYFVRQDEHRLLGEVMQVLLRHSTCPKRYSRAV